MNPLREPVSPRPHMLYLYILRMLYLAEGIGPAPNSVIHGTYALAARPRTLLVYPLWRKTESTIPIPLQVPTRFQRAPDPIWFIFHLSPLRSWSVTNPQSAPREGGRYRWSWWMRQAMLLRTYEGRALQARAFN